MTQVLRESTAVDVLVGPFVDKTDGATAETGEGSATVKLSKNGQTLAAKNGSGFTHDADGYYNCVLSATDTNTIGTLVLTVAASANALPVRHEFQVLDTEAYDSLYSTAPTIMTDTELKAINGLVYDSTITTVTSQTEYIMTDAFPNSSWAGLICTITDISTGHVCARYVQSTVESTETIVINSAPDFTAVATDEVRVFAIQHPSYALINYDAGTGADISTARSEVTDVMTAYVQLMCRSDSAIATDQASYLAEINSNLGSGAGSYDNTTDAQESRDVNVSTINDTTVQGTGITGDLWRG